MRSHDLYARARAEKLWRIDDSSWLRAEQVYRYGTKSEHFARSTLELGWRQSQSVGGQGTDTQLINQSHLSYTHKDHQENLDWSNSLYREHRWQAPLGIHSFSYGLYAGGAMDDAHRHSLNSYGPYISYRQPIWRPWLFVQGDISHYNNKDAAKDHHTAFFGRLQMVF